MSKAPVICEKCEKVFMGGEKAFICPKCRKKIASESAKKINLSKIGNEARWKKAVTTMPDNKLTDVEIKKALECCVSEQYTCEQCPYQEKKHYDYDNGFEIMPNGMQCDDWSCDRWLLTDLLDLINRLQEKDETRHKVFETKCEELEIAKAENERLRKENFDLKNGYFQKRYKETEHLELMGMKEAYEKASKSSDYFQLKAMNLEEDVKTAKAEAYKEFAEKLKNEIINDTAYACDSSQHSGYYDYQIKIGDIPEYIDNLLKEIIGE